MSSDVNATHAPTDHQMIWSTSYHHVTVLVHRSWPHLLFTVASVIGAKSCSSFTVTVASDLPFTLATGPSSQASSWSSPLWSHDSMSCLMCNELLHHHIITCGLISCVSHINTVSPPKLSLNYQNQTRTFQLGNNLRGYYVCEYIIVEANRILEEYLEVCNTCLFSFSLELLLIILI